MRRSEHRPRSLTPVVEGRERNRFFVRGDLKDGVGAGIEDRPSRALMLFTETRDDLRPRGRDVPQRRDSADRGEALDHLSREALRIGWERNFRDNAGHLPMPRDGIFAARALAHAPDGGLRIGNRHDAAHVRYPTESKPLEIRQRQTTQSFRDIADRVRTSRIAITRGVR